MDHPSVLRASFRVALALGLSLASANLRLPAGAADFQGPKASPIYGKIKPAYLNKTIAELLNQVPELKGLEPAEGDLSHVLKNVGEIVQTFFMTIPDVASLETIQQDRLGRNGEVEDRMTQEFYYMLASRITEFGLGFEEYRTDHKGKRVQPQGLKGAYVLTSGYASAAMFLHPQFQHGSSFRYLGKQLLQERNTHVIAFAQRPESAELTGVMLSEKHSGTVILVQGIAWIDASDYQLLRLRTELLVPRLDVGLGRQTTQIEFGEVRFEKAALSLWLPRQVAVTITLNNKTFQNRHSYSDFHLFSVETIDKISPPVPKKPE